MVHTLALSFKKTNVCPNGSPSWGYNMTFKLTIHIRDLWQLVY